jgi:hypothetical protein
VEDIKREFRNRITNLALENKALQDQIAKMQKDLKWAIDEIKELERDATEGEEE